MDNRSDNTAHRDSARAAQQKLADDVFYKGKVDGMMNQATRAALREYQKQNNLPVTGRITRDTAQSMGIPTSSGRFEDNSGTPIEQSGRGIAEGAKSNNNNNKTNNNRQNQHEQQ